MASEHSNGGGGSSPFDAIEKAIEEIIRAEVKNFEYGTHRIRGQTDDRAIRIRTVVYKRRCSVETPGRLGASNHVP